MGKKEYTRIGKCIWCNQEKPIVSFKNKPHTISKKIGANYIGFDICDTCNHYFGSNSKYSKYPMSIELAFKEIFNVTRHLLSDCSKSKTLKNSRLRSVYFEYYKAQKTFKLKKKFEFKKDFITTLTRQFKKGVYEAFLQEYHRSTIKGLDERFDEIRKFVRYDVGDLPVYFANNNGVYLLPEDFDTPIFNFNEFILSTIDQYGFYSIWLFGHILYIEVAPIAKQTRISYLNSEAKAIVGAGFINRSIREMQYVTDLDFTLTKLGKM